MLVGDVLTYDGNVLTYDGSIYSRWVLWEYFTVWWRQYVFYSHKKVWMSKYSESSPAIIVISTHVTGLYRNWKYVFNNICRKALDKLGRPGPEGGGWEAPAEVEELHGHHSRLDGAGHTEAWPGRATTQAHHAHVLLHPAGEQRLRLWHSSARLYRVTPSSHSMESRIGPRSGSASQSQGRFQIGYISIVQILEQPWLIQFNLTFSECPHAIDNDSDGEDVIILWTYVSLSDKVWWYNLSTSYESFVFVDKQTLYCWLCLTFRASSQPMKQQREKI